MSTQDEPQAWVRLFGIALVVPLLLVTQVWIFWTMWVYFVGGTVPLLAWHTNGNLPMFLVTLWVVEPLAVTLVQWAFLLVLVPLGRMFHRDVIPGESAP
jgi:hypothetical protein